MRTQDKVQEQAFCETYGDALTDPFPDALYTRWFQAGAVPARGPGAVLDAGTGAGHFGWRLARAGFQVTGVDLSPRMAARANQCGFDAVSLALLGDWGAAAENHRSAPGMLGRLCRLRDGMYAAAWRCLPRPLGCTTLIARASRTNRSQ